MDDKTFWGLLITSAVLLLSGAAFADFGLENLSKASKFLSGGSFCVFLVLLVGSMQD